MADAVFPWATMLNLLARNAVVCRGIFGTAVMSTGNGPISLEEFDDFLRHCKIAPYELMSEEPEILVIGWHDWDSAEIQNTLEDRIGRELRVYSQEMVFVSLAIGEDLFDVCSREELVTFGVGHPGLEFLMEDMGFDWPTTNVSLHQSGVHGGNQPAWLPETGILKSMGYVVGKNGLPQTPRQKILDTIYKRDMKGAPGFNPNYLDRWGSPTTARRLEKMANCIATFARQSKLKTRGDYSKAIADWESDLEYLKRKYYKKGFSFRWPDVDVL